MFAEELTSRIARRHIRRLAGFYMLEERRGIRHNHKSVSFPEYLSGLDIEISADEEVGFRTSPRSSLDVSGEEEAEFRVPRVMLSWANKVGMLKYSELCLGREFRERERRVGSRCDLVVRRRLHGGVSVPHSRGTTDGI